MQAFFRSSSVFHNFWWFLWVFKLVIWVFKDFGWFPLFLRWFHGFGWFPWFSGWFLFFHGLGFHGFIYDMESICVSGWENPKTYLPELYQGATIQSRPASTTNCRFLLICQKLCKLGKLNGDQAFKKAVLNTWVRTWAVMAGDAWCNVYALSFSGLKTIFV